MTIAAYGFGLSGLTAAAAGGDNVFLTLDAEPDIILEPDITITLDDDDIDITVDPDIDITVE